MEPLSLLNVRNMALSYAVLYLLAASALILQPSPVTLKFGESGQPIWAAIFMAGAMALLLFDKDALTFIVGTIPIVAYSFTAAVVIIPNLPSGALTLLFMSGFCFNTLALWYALEKVSDG